MGRDVVLLPVMYAVTAVVVVDKVQYRYAAVTPHTARAAGHGFKRLDKGGCFLFGGGRNGFLAIFWFTVHTYSGRSGVWRGTFDTFDTGGLPMACPGGGRLYLL